MFPDPNIILFKQYPNKLLTHHYKEHLGLVSCKVCSRFETPGFIQRHEMLAHREQTGDLPEKDDAQIPESEATVQDTGGDAFEEVELSDGIKVGLHIQTTFQSKTPNTELSCGCCFS